MSREVSGEVALKPGPECKLARQKVGGEHSRQKKQPVKRAHRTGTCLLHIPGAEEASMFEARERGDKGRLGPNNTRLSEDLELYPKCTGSRSRALGLFMVVLT